MREARLYLKGQTLMKRLVFLALLFALPMGALAAPLQQYITKDCAVFVQLEKLNDIISEVEGYAVKYGIPIGKGQMGAFISMQLTGKLGFPGFDLARPFGVFLFQKGGELEGTVIMIPVSDQKVFQNLLDEKHTFDGSIVQYRDRYAVIASDKDAQAAFERGAKKEVSQLPEAQILVYADASLMKGQLQNLMSNARNLQGKGGAAQIMGSFMKVQGDVIDEVKDMSYGLSFGAQGIEFVSAMEARPNTKLASVLTSLPAGEPSLIARMPADSYLVGGARVDIKALQPMYEMLSGLFDSMGEGLGKAIGEIVKEVGEIYGDDSAFALVPNGKGIFTALGAAAISPDRDSRALYQKLTERLNALPSMKKIGCTFTYTPNAGRIGADAYDLMKIDIVPPKSANAKTIGLLRDSLVVYIVRKGGIEYTAAGSDVQGRLADLISGSKPGFTTTAAWKALNSNYGKSAKNGIVYFSTSGFVQEALRVIPLLGLGDRETKPILDALKKAPKGDGIYGIVRSVKNVISVQGLLGRGEVDVFYSLIMNLAKQIF